ncbi:MAG: zinc ribbon domain-containing protein [Planctomycetota bacterium]
MNSLLHLYQVDSQVRGLRSRLDAAKRYHQAQTRQLEDLLQQQTELEARRLHTQATIANLETETAGIDEHIEKLRDELNSAVTNKQYTALLTELNTFKSQRSDIEERELREMEVVEQLVAQKAELDGQIAERQKVRDVAAEQLREREAEIGERLAELEKERETAAAGVPSDALSVFDDAANVHEGEAMAPIDEIDRRSRDYACGACHMTLPFEHVAVLLSGGDTIVRCTACSRILFMQEETRGALSKQ